MKKDNLENKIKNIILISLYAVLGVISVFLPNKDIGDSNAIVCFLLIITRFRIIYALKPTGIVHWDGSKYWFQKRGLLEKFKKNLQIEEKILAALSAVLFILAIFVK